MHRLIELWDGIEHVIFSDDVTRPKPDQEGVFNVSEAQEDGRSA